MIDKIEMNTKINAKLLKTPLWQVLGTVLFEQ